MKVWVDAQLSPAIARWLQITFGIEAVAVRDLGLLEAKDREISPGKNTEFRDKPSPLRSPAGGYRTSQPRARSSPGSAPYGVSLTFDSSLHFRLPPDIPSRATRRVRLHATSGSGPSFRTNALVTSVWGSLRAPRGLGFDATSSPHLLLRAHAGRTRSSGRSPTTPAASRQAVSGTMSAAGGT